MTLSRNTIIGIIGVVVLLLAGLQLPRLMSTEAKPSTDPAYITALTDELASFGAAYSVKVEQKTAHEAALKTISAELRELSCKALSTRIVLCQRGKDDYCTQEQEARSAMISTYGSPFETVCRKDFTKQVTGS